ncbi:MAG: hypothetical protein IPO35_00745 [Uliginosibacterium sp.]|nr:hypothetical protein [Uliginosibacterium sp.]
MIDVIDAVDQPGVGVVQYVGGSAAYHLSVTQDLVTGHANVIACCRPGQLHAALGRVHNHHAARLARRCRIRPGTTVLNRATVFFAATPSATASKAGGTQQRQTQRAQISFIEHGYTSLQQT